MPILGDGVGPSTVEILNWNEKVGHEYLRVGWKHHRVPVVGNLCTTLPFQRRISTCLPM